MTRLRMVRRGPRFVIRRITTIGIVILGCVFAGESHAGPGASSTIGTWTSVLVFSALPRPAAWASASVCRRVR